MSRGIELTAARNWVVDENTLDLGELVVVEIDLTVVDVLYHA